MESKSPGYEKLLNSPAGKKRFRFKLTRMLSSGNLKASSTPASPTTPRLSPQSFERQANSLESIRRSVGAEAEETKSGATLTVPVAPRPRSCNISKSIKVRDGVKTFLDKAKSRNVPLHLGTIMTFDTDNCENNTVEKGEVEQSVDLPWSMPEDYDANNEARLLSTHLYLQSVIRIQGGATGCADSRCNDRFSKNNVLLDTYEWKKCTELGPHMMNKFCYDLSEIQCVLDQSSNYELSIRNMCKSEDITDDVKISYHWEYSEGLSLPMGSMIMMAVSELMRNGNTFMKTITLQRDYRTCTFNRYDVEAIFHLKPIINYRLEIMRSSEFKELYDNIVKCVIMQKSEREEIRRVGGVNVVVFQVYDDGGVYKIFKQLLNSKYNINSYNVL
ncbi:hypothetical protein FQA39_LY01481 [Lamprigera yunnana]|nr:hypothetical protein FQA39_LY01481 [Lamprigera yunnana]